MQTVWHLTVREPDAPAGATRRFRYATLQDAMLALARADAAGFETRLDTVLSLRDRREPVAV